MEEAGADASAGRVSDCSTRTVGPRASRYQARESPPRQEGQPQDPGYGALFFQDNNDNITQQFDNSSVLGTADYPAPEQGTDSHNVDIRADTTPRLTFFLLTGVGVRRGTVTQKLLWHQISAPKSARVGEVPASGRDHREDDCEDRGRPLSIAPGTGGVLTVAGVRADRQDRSSRNHRQHWAGGNVRLLHARMASRRCRRTGRRP